MSEDLSVKRGVTGRDLLTVADAEAYHTGTLYVSNPVMNCLSSKKFYKATYEDIKGRERR
jgi:hypothetical protein